MEDKVISLRRAGESLESIQEYINTNILKEPGQFISIMSLSRWLNKHLPDYKEHDQRYSNVSINEYNELLDMLDYSESQLEIAEKTLHDLKKAAQDAREFSPDDLKAAKKALSAIKDVKSREVLKSLVDKAMTADHYANPKDVTALINSMEKTLARRQSILADIIGCKEKILSFVAMQKIISTAMKKVKDKDILMYAEIKNDFNNDPMVAEAFKRIPDVASKTS